MAKEQSAPGWTTGAWRTGASSVFTGILLVSALGSQAQAQPFAYVASRGIGGAVSVIDIQTNSVVATISLPPAGPSRNVAVSPDGTRVYASNDSFPDAVSVIDTATHNILVPAIPVGTRPRGIAVSHDSKFVYVPISLAAAYR